ncbi:hypothetical protein J6TS2_33480 [Heyndrickxia sporothermodurans]|nr:hypothetical protein J6TS2_33480 [Heyndrickxia sporothermodurans]
MANARYKFHYVNGEKEELETKHRYNTDAKSELATIFHHNKSWISAGGKTINLANVISIEVVGEEEKMTLKLNLNVDNK